MPLEFSSFNLDELAESFAGTSDELMDMARSAENSERYEDMCHFMRQRVTKFSEPLSTEERNLLSVAYKNVIGSRRSAWRHLSAEMENEGAPESSRKLIGIYKQQIENELEIISKDVLNLLEEHLIKENGAEAEEQVFFLKMAGDYYRYLTESVYSDEYKENTNSFYKRAEEIAMVELPPTHPIRLGLALNYSVCHFEILRSPEAACQLAKSAFDEAISKLDELNEADYKDSTLIMQLLRDNLTLWTSDVAVEEFE